MKGKKLVEHTNDWSIDSKRSMVDLGYFKDDFIHLFSSKKRRSPLINICYYIRASIIDKALRQFIALNTSLYQVISLGSGFDTTFFRLFRSEDKVKYIEIDLPSVVKNKIEILLDAQETRCLLKNHKVGEENNSLYYLTSDHFTIFSQNLDNIQELDKNLKQFGIDYAVPTVLLSEVAITYMEETSCSNLCEFLAKFTNGVLIVYEQINPHDGFGKFMMNHFNTIQSPLKSLTRYNRVKPQSLYYIEKGWQESLMFNVIDLYNRITPAETFIKVAKIEPQDEWEEFHLTCLHYGLYIAANGTMRTFFNSSFVLKTTEYLFIEDKQLTCHEVKMNKSIDRFKHSLIQLDQDKVAMLGGVGVENNCHRKTSVISIINLQNNEITEIGSSYTQLALTHMASCSFVIKNTTYYFLFGGCKSPVREDSSILHVLQYNPPLSVSLTPVLMATDSQTPCHRWRHSVIANNKKIFIFGGRTANFEILNDFWEMSLVQKGDAWQGSWTQLVKGPNARFSHSCVLLSDGSIIVYGGLDSNFQPLGDTWKWNPSSGWQEITVQNTIPRYGHTCHLINEFRLLLVGGVTFHPANPEISIIDLNRLTSTHFHLPTEFSKDSVMIHNHQSIVTLKDQILTLNIIGGGGNCFSFGTSFNKSIISIPLQQLIS